MPRDFPIQAVSIIITSRTIYLRYHIAGRIYHTFHARQPSRLTSLMAFPVTGEFARMGAPSHRRGDGDSISWLLDSAWHARISRTG